ncbi:DUF802 domain-containing protein [Zoogloea sp.]|uniref:DUF802 domain-containing protein n=1 Tax=Zoogloea sp. TaxID=49181 RepID=UPI001AD5EE56|nr:DUF802 domain-containing protein [Zoogloea sp.]MBN8285098.1 DUF802 domain-containing protein [Zoogloea sp.]
MKNSMYWGAFFLGLVVIAWVAVGYVGGSPLALLMTLLIGVVYLAGALELRRFNLATASLSQALASIPDGLQTLDSWILTFHPSLHNAVRLRVDGERVGLPAPSVTPYLVGLLVLLGMLGTFLGMVVTLNGAVLALESTTDLQTIRASLAAPVKGLGVAFGTSVAGVAASALLGLMSTLCRRERLQVSQVLDSRIATVLREFSMAHQRQETFKALQMQAQALPSVVDKLHGMMEQMERHSQQLGERLLASQESHHREARVIYSELAASVDASLKHSLMESARIAGDTIRPAVETTMSGIAQETATLYQKLASTVEAQLDGVSARFESSVSTVSETWTRALVRHEQTGDALNSELKQTLTAHTDTFERQSASLLATVERTHGALQADLASVTRTLADETKALHAGLTQATQSQLEELSNRFERTATQASASWSEVLGRHEQSSISMGRETQAALAATVGHFEQTSASLLASVGASHAEMQEASAAQDQQRLDALTQVVESMASTLQKGWQAAGEQAHGRQLGLLTALEESARQIGATTAAQATRTIEEVARLMQTASEAPKAAAEVIAQLRQELSASMARDNAMLQERTRIMETLGALLDAITHASTDQRQAIDALVGTSAELLERVGTRFESRMEAESGRMSSIAAQIELGAVEVSSLSEAFGHGVHLFSESNEKLMDALGRIEEALSASMARSDEQLAYYVAQAREVIDLSIMSQKQVIEDLQGLAGRTAPMAGGA